MSNIDIRYLNNMTISVEHGNEKVFAEINNDKVIIYFTPEKSDNHSATVISWCYNVKTLARGIANEIAMKMPFAHSAEKIAKKNKKVNSDSKGFYYYVDAIVKKMAKGYVRKVTNLITHKLLKLFESTDDLFIINQRIKNNNQLKVNIVSSVSKNFNIYYIVDQFKSKAWDYHNLSLNKKEMIIQILGKSLSKEGKELIRAVPYSLVNRILSIGWRDNLTLSDIAANINKYSGNRTPLQAYIRFSVLYIYNEYSGSNYTLVNKIVNSKISEEKLKKVIDEYMEITGYSRRGSYYRKIDLLISEIQEYYSLILSLNRALPINQFSKRKIPVTMTFYEGNLVKSAALEEVSKLIENFTLSNINAFLIQLKSIFVKYSSSGLDPNGETDVPDELDALEKYRIKKAIKLKDYGREYGHCLGSYYQSSFKDNYFFKYHTSVAHVKKKRNTYKLIQCYDKRNSVTKDSRYLREMVKKEINKANKKLMEDQYSKSF